MEFNLNEGYYRSPQEKLWKGRQTRPELGNQYWYQEVELMDINVLEDKLRPNVALLGYACDEGVRRNRGRVGAKEGANAIRQQLAKFSYHHAVKGIADIGDIVCDDKELETCQEELSKVVSELVSNSIFPILMGGGHDIAYGHFKGIHKTLEKTAKPKVGIINFDAHFDLRPVESEANSGTPFYQILKEHNDTVDYFAIGIQQQVNTKELFDIAKENKVEYLLNYECNIKNVEAVIQRLKPFVDNNDWLYITIDMDGFSSAYAPGVSAPSPMGFTPNFVIHILKYLLNSGKVISCDIAELNPILDQDNTTAKLAAILVDSIVASLPQN